jgi:hypothetical protein
MMNPHSNTVDIRKLLTFTFYFFIFNSINEYQGRSIPCSDNISIGVGTSEECPLPGEEVIVSLGIYGILQNFWFNVAMVVVLQIVFRLGAYMLLRRSK